MKKAIINTIIYDFNEFIEKGYIVFDEKVAEVGSMDSFVDRGYQIIDGKNHLTMPSLVAGHTHIYSTFARGMSVPFNPKDFQGILDQLWWKLDRNLNNEMNYYSGIVGGTDYLKNGVTTLIDHHASGIDIKGSLNSLKKAICNDVGIRGVFAFETSDRFSVKKAIEENTDFIRDNNSQFSSGLFGLHASMSLSEKTLTKVSQSLNKSPIHIHVAESVLDGEDAQKKYQEKIIKRLNRHNLLNKNSLLAHCIYLDDEELEIISETKSVIVVNFTSNMNNSVGIPDLSKFRKHNIKTIIGNDGISSSMASEYLSLYYATHLLDKTPTTFGLDKLLKMIKDTYEYANDVLGTKLGKLEENCEADLLMIPYIPPTPITKDNAFGHLFFGMFHSFKPKNVFVNGKQLVANYKVNDLLENKYSKARASAEKLWINIRKEGK